MGNRQLLRMHASKHTHTHTNTTTQQFEEGIYVAREREGLGGWEEGKGGRKGGRGRGRTREGPREGREGRVQHLTVAHSLKCTHLQRSPWHHYSLLRLCAFEHASECI